MAMMNNAIMVYIFSNVFIALKNTMKSAIPAAVRIRAIILRKCLFV